MKVKKIKVSSILLKLTYSVACCALGWYLHGRFAPVSGAGFVQETPHVLVSDLSKSDTSAKKKYIAEVEAINSVDIIPQVSGFMGRILRMSSFLRIAFHALDIVISVKLVGL